MNNLNIRETMNIFVSVESDLCALIGMMGRSKTLEEGQAAALLIHDRISERHKQTLRNEAVIRLQDIKSRIQIMLEECLTELRKEDI